MTGYNSVWCLSPGQLYLGVFSGPVEGILMIVGIYTITGFCGQHLILMNAIAD